MFSMACSRVARVAVKTSSIRSPALAAGCSSFSIDGNMPMKGRFFHASPAAQAKLNVEGLAERVDLKGANVLMRVDLNVPLAKVRTFSIYGLSLLVREPSPSRQAASRTAKMNGIFIFTPLHG
jgi:hypothetical protein